MTGMRDTQSAFGSEPHATGETCRRGQFRAGSARDHHLKDCSGGGTRSLGILSEAAHSALDLIAALVTFFSVRVSDKPADADHQYGHGKVESFSAFIETALLLMTCVWIVYEAGERFSSTMYRFSRAYTRSR